MSTGLIGGFTNRSATPMRRQSGLTTIFASTRVDAVTFPVPDPNNPAEALAAVVSLRRLADRLEAASVQAAIPQGWSWSRGAMCLGVSKQAVHKRYARRLSPP